MPGIIQATWLVVGLSVWNSAFSLAIPNTTAAIGTGKTSPSDVTGSTSSTALIATFGQLSDLDDILAKWNLTLPLPLNVSNGHDLPTIAPAQEIDKVRAENEGLPIECRKG